MMMVMIVIFFVVVIAAAVVAITCSSEGREDYQCSFREHLFSKTTRFDPFCRNDSLAMFRSFDDLEHG